MQQFKESATGVFSSAVKTEEALAKILRDQRIRNSMDDRGGWQDNVFIERLRHSIKYGNLNLKACEIGPEVRIAR